MVGHIIFLRRWRARFALVFFFLLPENRSDESLLLQEGNISAKKSRGMQTSFLLKMARGAQAVFAAIASNILGSRCAFIYLPAEIWQMILSRADAQVVRLVCRAFRDMLPPPDRRSNAKFIKSAIYAGRMRVLQLAHRDPSSLPFNNVDAVRLVASSPTGQFPSVRWMLQAPSRINDMNCERAIWFAAARCARTDVVAWLYNRSPQRMRSTIGRNEHKVELSLCALSSGSIATLLWLLERELVDLYNVLFAMTTMCTGRRRYAYRGHAWRIVTDVLKNEAVVLDALGAIERELGAEALSKALISWFHHTAIHNQELLLRCIVERVPQCTTEHLFRAFHGTL
jgi:hypothetical protein